MDLMDSYQEANLYQEATSHFEYVVGQDHYDRTLKTRQKALLAMAQLEGWCSEFKAAVLIDFVLMLKPKKIVEIGVFGGKSLVPMAFALKALGSGVIVGVDPWDNKESAQGMEGVNKDWWSGIDHQAILNGLNKKIKEFNLQSHIELVRATSKNAPAITDIGILHIDGNHSEETSLIDVLKWVPLVSKGGLIIFDDLNWNTTSKAVEWLNANCVKLTEFKGDNVWGIWVKP